MTPALRVLAERAGILASYRDVEGRVHEASEATLAALLSALGLDPGASERDLPPMAQDALPLGGRCPGLSEVLSRGEQAASRAGTPPRAFGLAVNLYSVRSRTNWGMGDLSDLARLAEWAGERGADFVLLPPLHAAGGGDTEASPYSPSSRLFRSAAYLDVEAVPEMADCAEGRLLAEDPAFRRDLERARSSDRISREAVMLLKRPVLELLHRAFAVRHREKSTPRGQEYDAFRARHGEALDDFATHAALEDARGPGERRDWPSWPSKLRAPRGAAVRAFQREHAEEVDFHRFVQFELDRQLAEAARRARRAGMRLGLIQDLAVGSAGNGADAWMFPGLFVEGAAVGCPPDPLGPLGQDWAFPPLSPARLRESGGEYWSLLLRTAFSHAGGLRVDHAFGLTRLFWIPRGRPASEGAYVRQPTADLLRLLALEANAARAVVIGEDLGTAPDGFDSTLEAAGILSTRVLWFERESDGSFRAPEALAPRALLAATTHDLPTIAGWWAGRDLEIRRSLGLLAAGDFAVERSRRDRDREQLAAALRREGLLADSAAWMRPGDLAGAVHSFLWRSPAALVTVSLDDLLGETEPMNVPGTTQEVFPSWTRRTRLHLEDLDRDPMVTRAWGTLARA